LFFQIVENARLSAQELEGRERLERDFHPERDAFRFGNVTVAGLNKQTNIQTNKQT